VVDTSNNSVSEQRNAIRQHQRQLRRALSQAQLSAAAASLTPHVLQVLDSIEQTTELRRVAGYLAFQGEIDVAPVLQALRARDVLTYVPMLKGETLGFAAWSDSTPHTINRFGIVEPQVPEHDWISAVELDAVLVPLVAFDNDGQRMGMGGGFYDKTFAQRRDSPAPPWLIGVAHSIQQVATVHADWWDVAAKTKQRPHCLIHLELEILSAQ